MESNCFSPSNALLSEVKERVAELLPGTPAWALFPRWYVRERDGVIMVEASSGSVLARVNLRKNVIVMSERLRLPARVVAFRKVEA